MQDSFDDPDEKIPKRSLHDPDVEIDIDTRTPAAVEESKKLLSSNGLAKFSQTPRSSSMSQSTIAKRKNRLYLWDPKTICLLSLVLGSGFGETLFYLNFQTINSGNKLILFFWIFADFLVTFMSFLLVLLKGWSVWDIFAALMIMRALWLAVSGIRYSKYLLKISASYTPKSVNAPSIYAFIAFILVALLPSATMSTVSHKSYLSRLAGVFSKNSGPENQKIWIAKHKFAYTELCVATQIKYAKTDAKTAKIIFNEQKAHTEANKVCSCVTDFTSAKFTYKQAIDKLLQDKNFDAKITLACMQ